MFIKLKILLFVFLSCTIVAQNTYKVSKDGNANFKSIAEVNNANLKSGDIVSFQSGQQFDDAVLKCKEGVTYNTFGGTNRAIIGNPTGNFDRTVQVDYKDVKLSNLKLVGYKNADNVITFSKKNLTIIDCEIVGGENAHGRPTMGIRQTKIDAGTGHKFVRNKIHDLGWGIFISRPYNTEIGYNEMFDFWIKDGKMDHGGYAIGGDNISGLSDTWDTKYTFIFHHNEIYNFEYTVFAVGASRMIIEYNNIHNNLDERLYRGGVKHGSLGKLFDNSRVSTGTVGQIFRYNYVHDLIRRGLPNYTYGIPTPANLKNGTPNIVSTNNGTGQAVYLNAVLNNENNFGEHFGDELGEAPGAVIGGLGYGNIWIHNNIFENCSNRIFLRTAIDGSFYGSNKYREDLSTYLVNNTIINCGFRDYVTNNIGLINTEWQMYSDHVLINNIIDFTNPKALATIYIKGNESPAKGKLYIDNNIFTKQGKVVTSAPNHGDKTAIWFAGSKRNHLSGNSEQYFTNPNWNDVNGTYFAANIGPKGAYIPDVRLKKGGNANNKGRDFNLLGDTFTDPLGKHKLGEDPTGRSFAYDILGNLRTTNDIGAVGTVDGGGVITPSDSPKAPVITIQPSNVSTTEGSEATFSVTATCEDPIGYQWWKSPFVSQSESKIENNSKFSGATTNVLTIKNVESSDSEVNYVCEVYNTKDHKNLWVNSDAASLQVTSPNPGGDSKLVTGLKVYLEAPFQNNSLDVKLNHSGVFPLKQPYNRNPWNYNEDIKIGDIKPNYVDWLLVELRDNLTNTKYRKSGILVENGIILNTDGTNFSFNNIVSGSYYIVIKHRNHISIMSSKKVSITERVGINYDFTTSVNSAYGNNALVKLGNDKFGMFAGDADANGVVNNLDFGIVANNIPKRGYYQGDLDMNGVINVLDYSLINKNILKSSNVPNK